MNQNENANFGRSYQVMRLYFISVGTLILCLLLSFVLMSHKSAQIEALQKQEDQFYKVLEELEELANSASELNAPGNDIFSSKSFDFEESRFKIAEEHFNQNREKIESLMSQVNSLSGSLLLDRPAFDRISILKNKITHVTYEIFENLKQNKFAIAARYMSELDKSNSKLAQTFGQIRKSIFGNMERSRQEFHSVVQNSRIFEIALIGIFIFSFALNFIFAFKFAKKMKKIDHINRDFSFILDAFKIGVWTYYPKTNVSFWDKSLLRLYEIDEKDFAGHNEELNRLLKPEALAQLTNEIKDALQGKNEFNTKFEIRTKSGNFKQIASRGKIVRDSLGQPQIVYGINYDVTDQFQLEREKEQMFRLLNTVLENIPSMIIVKSFKSNLSYLHINKAGEKILGIDQKTIQGKTDHDFMLKHEADLINQLDRNVFLNGKVTKIERETINTSAGKRVLTTHKVPIFDENSNPDLLICISNDITEEVELKENLEIEKSKNINSAKLASLGEMAGGIAHEINNPLAIIRGRAAQLLRSVSSGSEDREKAIDYLTLIVNMCDRITKIINGLKNYSRNGENDEFQVLFLNEVISDTLILCKEKLAQYQIDLKVSIDPGLQVKGRHVQLSQVILNLLNNSVYAISKIKDRWIRVEANVNQEKQIVLSITDSGGGIDKSVQEKLMSPFFTTKPVGHGTGLGLSISKGIIEKHGGRMFYDTYSTNTRFVIELPSTKTNQRKVAS